MDDLKKYFELNKEIAAYNLFSSIYSYDFYTIAPKSGREYSLELSNIIDKRIFDLYSNEELFDTLKKLIDQDIDDEMKKEFILSLEEIKKIRAIPKDVYKRKQEIFNNSILAWEKARESKDYNLFKANLKSVVEIIKETVRYRNEDKTIYEQLLNDFVRGSSIETYDNFFNMIKLNIVPLVKKISDKKIIDNSFLKIKIPISKQKEIVKILAEYLGFNEDFGYISESIHPFSSMISPNDIRITTKYLENDLMTSFLSVAHEIGHGLYSHNVKYPYIGSQKEKLISMAMHESQSIFLEKYVVGSYYFWKYFYPKLQNVVDEFKNIEINDFYRAINKSQPSLIRVDADELTYPIHILIRYELEKEIIDGNVDFEHLNKIWADKYEEYLNIRPNDDLEGILQDIHWNDSFGYFPAYALGCAIAAQINNYLIKNFDLENKLENGDFSSVSQWLKENIHQYGGLYDYNEILERVTKEKFNPSYYIEYLKEKFEKLYGINKK